jgi:hypothetical protein
MHKPTSFLLRTIGAVLLLVGLVGAYYGPLEIFVFYLFSRGGQFYYDGFGMGAFWFGALVVQNLGYYVIAVICLPLGIGHLGLRRWTPTLARLVLTFWLGAGLLLLGNGLLLIPAFFKLDLERNVLLFRLIAGGTALLCALVLLPVLGLWFYKRETVQAAFKANEEQGTWIERFPFPVLALLLSYVIMIAGLHVTIFFQGIFPMFGQIWLGRPAAYVISLCFVILCILIYGTVQLKKWAWWGGWIFISLLSVSTLLSFAGRSIYDLLLMMNLPAYEMEFLDRMVLYQDVPMAGYLVPPLLLTLGLILYSGKYFRE